MYFSIILTYLPYSLVTAFTPGPNNIVALKKVARSESAYADVKSEIYESYREEFDQDIDKTYFDSAVNMLLAERR